MLRRALLVFTIAATLAVPALAQETVRVRGTIERIDGSFFNVMGLPIQRVYTELNQFIQSIKNNP